MQIDTRIHGATVYTSSGPEAVDVLIRGEGIAGLVEPSEEVDAREVIDASGLTIIPGLVDLHAHSRTPGLSHKEDFRTISHAAAVGGITTIVDMPNVEPPTDSVERLQEKRAIADGDCIVDWGHFVSGSQPDRVQELAAAGATGFKIFMVGGGYPHDDRIAVSSNSQLYRALRAIAPTGLPCLVHPFDQALFDMFLQEAYDAGDPPDHVTRIKVYTGIDIVWRSAVATLLEFQRETGVRLHLLHTHASGSLRLIREAKKLGARVTAAVDPKYFHLTWEDMEEQGPRAYSGAMVSRDPERLALIWQSLKDGTIDTIDSDHAPHTLEEGEIARVDASKAQLGSPQYDDMLSLMLTDVNAGVIDLRSVVRLMCENPARLIGRYPQKGAICVGSDADLVILDMSATRVVRDEDIFSKVRWTPYAGRQFVGVPIQTILRGQTIARNREIYAPSGYGRYLEGRPQDFTDSSRSPSAGLALTAR